jgi:hypothetical protein
MSNSWWMLSTKVDIFAAMGKQFRGQCRPPWHKSRKRTKRTYRPENAFKRCKKVSPSWTVAHSGSLGTLASRGLSCGSSSKFNSNTQGSASRAGKGNGIVFPREAVAPAPTNASLATAGCC